jgi:hypothetical protein
MVVAVEVKQEAKRAVKAGKPATASWLCAFFMVI